MDNFKGNCLLDRTSSRYHDVLVFGRSAQAGWRRYLYPSAIHKFVRDAPAVDVHISRKKWK